MVAKAADHGEIEARVRSALDAGDQRGAATVVIRGCGPELLRHLVKLLGDPSDARDAFSLTCERIWRGLPGFRWEASLRTWAHQLAWSAASDLRKDRWRTRARRLETDEVSSLVPLSGTASYIRVERMRLSFAQLREHLTLEDRALLQLRIDEELSWEECAVALSRPGNPVKPQTLTKRFERLKTRLAKLRDEGEKG
ncbi:MAG: RNA polymerase sigma factor [Anaeromyxobacter sp.]